MLVISHTKQKKIICFEFLPGVLHGQTGQFLLCPVTHLRESNPAQQSHTIPYHTGKVCPADALSLESLATVVITIQPPPPFLTFGSLSLWLGTSLTMWHFLWRHKPMSSHPRLGTDRLNDSSPQRQFHDPVILLEFLIVSGLLPEWLTQRQLHPWKL